MTTSTHTVLHLFAGLGGSALGFQQARGERRGLQGRFRTICGIDNDEGACSDFRALTGAPCIQADIATMTPAELRDACQGQTPDVVALSPPCKGFSGLLSSASAKTEKYQALNRLGLQALSLLLETFRAPPPRSLVMENVPRITASRGRNLLIQIRRLLVRHGYRIYESVHDCGALGGLAQHRQRYLLIARHERQMPVPVYRPPRRLVRPIGDVLGPLPMPEDAAAGPLHRLPRLMWKTWIRLALIPAGGDWRDLPNDGPYAVVSASRPNLMGIARWDRPTGTVTGSAAVSSSNGVAAVADPRVPDGTQWHRGIYRVMRWTEPSSTVTGRGVVSTDSASAVADPRVACTPRGGVYGVIPWAEPSGAVIGAADVHAGKAAVADPRIPAGTDQPDPPPIIIADDGTWHRPLTTLELAALQGLPTTMQDGSPLRLHGRSQARWRERIGNAVPPPAAQTIAESLLMSLLAVDAGERFVLGGTDIWAAMTTQADTMIAREDRKIQACERIVDSAVREYLKPLVGEPTKPEIVKELQARMQRFLRTVADRD